MRLHRRNWVTAVLFVCTRLFIFATTYPRSDAPRGPGDWRRFSHHGTSMLPYDHPTTCLAIDDDKLFLESFSHRYGDDILCATESNPRAAIERLRAQSASLATAGAAVHSPIAPTPGGLNEEGELIFRVETNSIVQIARRLERFSHISVVVVDYAMPAMTGIEFCRAIKDFPVRKILLTGKAGDTTAVAAFNEGLIDFFLVKQDAALSEKLPAEIRRAQQAYFAGHTAGLAPIIQTPEAAFLRDAEVMTWLAAVAKKAGAVEHYLLTTTPGVMFADLAGKTAMAYVFGQDRMRAQLEIAEHEGAPAELIALLEGGDTLLVCPSRSGYYEPKFAASWSRYAFDATSLGEHGEWRVAVDRASAVDLKSVSLRQYRKTRAAL
jgi:CheY-like chemotaxis protein